MVKSDFSPHSRHIFYFTIKCQVSLGMGFEVPDSCSQGMPVLWSDVVCCRPSKGVSFPSSDVPVLLCCVSVWELVFPTRPVSLRTRVFILPRKLSAKILFFSASFPPFSFSSFCSFLVLGLHVHYFVPSVSSDLLPLFFSSVCSFVL